MKAKLKCYIKIAIQQKNIMMIAEVLLLTSTIVGAIFLMVASYVFGFSRLKKISNFNHLDLKRIRKLVILHFVLTTPDITVGILYTFGIHEIGQLLTFSLIPFHAFKWGIIAYITFFVIRHMDSRVVADNPQIFTQEELESTVKHLFLSAFNTVLPKGKKDEQYGLDYIPFMLQSIGNRQAKFTKLANRFLVTTIVLGILFLGLIGVFGYIILDDDSVGPNRTLAQIETHL